MLQAVNLSMRYASKTLFENINIKLDKGKRYGLIGANGAGKSTFLKILSGQVEPSSGDVVLGPGLRLGVLGQDQFAFESFTLKDAVLYGNKKLYDALKEKDGIYSSEDLSDEKINKRLADLEMICVEEDPMYECEVVVEKMLEELGFASAMHDDLVKTLRGGDKFKILLAQVLFPRPDVLLLDEPTNNLDLQSIHWLEERLKRHDGTLVVISHDRHFLNSVCTHTLDLDFKTLREFSGNYDDWYIASTLISKQHEMEQSKKLKERENLENFIRRFSANASKAKQATSRQKQLDKLTMDAPKLSSRRDPSIAFKPKRQIGNEALSIEGVSKSYGDLVVFRNISLTFAPGDKVAVIGPNGVGKSTLCEIIHGSLEPDSGVVKWGATVELGYFPQDVSSIVKGSETLYEWLRGFDKSLDSGDIRGSLGRMLFSGDDQEKSIDSLSGGEKHRIMLSRLMLSRGNFLILDEPTNHLDLESIIALGEALYNYSGMVVCASHDRELISAYANRIIELRLGENGASLVDFRGSYDEFLSRF